MSPGWPAVLVALAVATPLAAQPVASTLDKVEVVGSRVSRIEAETALPVEIIRREAIERSGVQTTEELLARVSANVNAWSEAINVGNDLKPGFSGASLRGLGAATTLVLLNGRRLANYAFSFAEAGVDLHAIPLAAIERVEILKDGASALYGSDAIAGVINFVLRRDFRGIEASAFAGASAGGASMTKGVLSAGVGELAVDGINAFAFVIHQRSGALTASARPFSATSYRPQLGLDRTSSNAFPGNIPLGRGRFANPAAPACTDATVAKNGGCYYDYPRQSDDLAPLEQTSVLGRATLRVGADHEAFVELVYESHRARYRISATPISNVTSNGLFEIDVPTTSPFFPAGLGLTGDIADVRYRTVSLGPRTSESRSDNERALVGMRGNAFGWDYDGAFAFAASHARFGFLSGYIDAAAAQSAFASGLVNPFGDSGAAGDALLAATQLRGEMRHATGITRSIDVHASREVAQLPAGPLAFALGVELRRESLSDVGNPLAASVLGSPFVPPKGGERDVRAAFAELNLPLLRGVEAQLSVRRDHYSDFGGRWNPKAALRWQPSRFFLARASVGLGFRAPSLPELFTARSTFLGELGSVGGDAVRCPVTGLDADCDPVVPVGFGGNPGLKAVRSKQESIGFVVQPTANWSASVDYWRISVRDDIGALDVETIFANAPAYEGRNIVRGPVDPAFPGLPGPIVRVDTYNQNLGRSRTAGFDLSGSYRSDARSWGRVGGRIDATLATLWTRQPDGITDTSALGVSANGDAIPRWKHQLTMWWERAPFAATLAQSFRTGYVDQQRLPDGSTRRVASYPVWDAQWAYAATKTLSLRLGVRNLFDRDPPFTNQISTFQVGYDPGYADPRGRFWYASATWQIR